MSNINVQGNSPSSQSVAPQYAHESMNRTAKFDPGLSGATMAAIVDVIEDMMLISILYGKQMIKQVNAQKDMGDVINLCEQEQGHALFSQALTQGITGIAGGALTALVGGYAMSSPPVSDIDAQLKGAKSYQKLVDNPPLVDGRIEEEQIQPASGNLDGNIGERLNTLKGKQEFSRGGKAVDPATEKTVNPATEKTVNPATEQVDSVSDKDFIAVLKKNERAELKESIDEKVKKLTEERQTIMNSHNARAQTFTNIASGISTAAQGAGTTVSAPYQKAQKDYEGQTAVAQSALSIGQGVSGQFRGDIDKYMGEVTSLTQIMAAISNANAIAAG